jgi:hypothetical protein
LLKIRSFKTNFYSEQNFVMPPKRRLRKPYQKPNAAEVVASPANRSQRKKNRNAEAADDASPELVCLNSGEERERAGMACENPFVNLLATAAETVDMNFDNFELPREVIRCVNDDMSVHVLPETCAKIWRGEYINLASLLKKDPMSDRGSNISLNEHGLLEVVAKPSRQIRNIGEWTDAFMIFMSIYIKKFPSKAGELLQYMSTIREAEGRTGSSFGWKSYDENFRYRQAVNPVSWAKINIDLWLKTMTGVQSQSNYVVNKATKSYSNSKQAQANTTCCFDFNSPRGCRYPNCRYAHKCLICKGAHNQMRCTQTMLKQNFRK